ncbi:hypothetical protein [Sporomusa sp. KB1]|jgi:hypothetical protein|uniref:hypothetical protein n=1 Tax=Sporomusa sp. KB1 TaxID=943346 RepID=UPI001C95FA40|nr:hypothetical protein [Sporomusa sp. KB1]
MTKIVTRTTPCLFDDGKPLLGMGRHESSNIFASCGIGLSDQQDKKRSPIRAYEMQ